MKFKKLLPALLFVMLIVLGCMHSKVLLSDKSDGGFPQFAAVNGTGVLESSRTDSFTFAVFGDCQGDQKSRQIISGILKTNGIVLLLLFSMTNTLALSANVLAITEPAVPPPTIIIFSALLLPLISALKSRSWVRILNVSL